MKFDFGGYVTKNDLPCSDGRIIRHGAFRDCDGARVPLVWQHMHDSVDNVLGYVDLENRDDGVYGYATLNDTPNGQLAKTMVRHGDIRSLSIYANQLRQRGAEVIHGMICEVSLVLSGANPGAMIDNLNFAHSDGSFDVIEEEAIIGFGEDISLAHADDEKVKVEEEVTETESEPESEPAKGEKTIQSIYDSLDEKQKAVADLLIGMAVEAAKTGKAPTIQHADDDSQSMAAESGSEIADLFDDDETIEDVLDSMSEEQRNAVYALMAMAVEDAGKDPAELAQMLEKSSDQGASSPDDSQNQNGEENLKQSGIEGVEMHNVFEGTGDTTKFLEHSEIEAIFKDARRLGSLKESVLEHGITNIDVLFPEAQAVNATPAQIARRMEWVNVVLSGTHKSPFSRVKSTAVNMTEEEARARGYIKGNKKVEEQIAALKRVTTPTTIYKLQKLDRDDVIDITDFDIIAFMKGEMRTMLDEELARAILVGDGRPQISNDKIKEDCIRPIWSDEDTYAPHYTIDGDKITDPTERAKAFIDSAIRAHKDYKGSGQPTLFVGPELLTEMRMIRDQIGHRLYKNDQELADELRVKNIVEVEILDGYKRDKESKELTFGGIIVNLADYSVGSTRGGEVSLFDDFDLDYNKYEYLIETRCSGALIQPMSALVIDFEGAKKV